MADKRLGLDVLYSSVRQLGDAIRTRKLSPVALTEAYLDRLERLGARYNAVVTMMRDSALREARQAAREIDGGRYRGPLHGIPYGAKDLLATNGVPTTWGAEPYRRQVFDYDATVVRKLRDAGAILVAKLAMVELAGAFGYNVPDASFTGPGRNPWDVGTWAGGSSSGSGSAVAAGLVAFAIGSETSGSIVTPCAYCGVTGLRPTYGRVSRYGAMALAWTLDKIGPMARTADDCGLVLAAIAGRDRQDPSSVGKRFTHPDPVRRWRIGVLRGATEQVQPEVRRNFEAAVGELEKFGDVTRDVEFPDLPYSDAVSVIVKAEGASAFRDLVDSGRTSLLRAPSHRWGAYAGALVPAIDYLQALRVRGVMHRQLAPIYARFDAILAPARATVATPIGMEFSRAIPARHRGPEVGKLITATNAVGYAAVVVPMGPGEKGLPTALQLTGRAWGEARLLAIAAAYQAATKWHLRRPPAPRAMG